MSPQMSKTPYCLGAGEGTNVSWFGASMMLKASDPGLGVCDNIVRPGDEPPMHVHRNEDEWFYVLEGEMTFHVGGQNLRGVAGSFASLPRGIPHTFTVESAEAHVLLFNTPGGFERMFERMPKTQEEAMAALAAFEIEVVGPHPRNA